MRNKRPYVVCESPGCAGWGWASKWNLFCPVCFESISSFDQQQAKWTSQQTTDNRQPQRNGPGAGNSPKKGNNGGSSGQGNNVQPQGDAMAQLAHLLLPLLSALPKEGVHENLKSVQELLAPHSKPMQNDPSMAALKHEAKVATDKWRAAQSRYHDTQKSINELSHKLQVAQHALRETDKEVVAAKAAKDAADLAVEALLAAGSRPPSVAPSGGAPAPGADSKSAMAVDSETASNAINGRKHLADQPELATFDSNKRAKLLLDEQFPQDWGQFDEESECLPDAKEAEQAHHMSQLMESQAQIDKANAEIKELRDQLQTLKTGCTAKTESPQAPSLEQTAKWMADQARAMAANPVPVVAQQPDSAASQSSQAEPAEPAGG